MNKEKFKEVYIEELYRAIRERPLEYGYPETKVPLIAERMVIAFEKGTASNNSIVVRRTCRRLGIKHTYKGIREFLGGDE